MRTRAWALWGLLVVGCGGSPEPDPATPDAMVPAQAICGDGVCEGTEVGACQADCGAAAACGDGACNGSETTATCPADCSTGGGGCGDGTCTAPETAQNCPGDCTTGGGGTAQCGNLVCEAGETAASCASDCGGVGGNACPGTGDVDCFFCWFDPTTCIAPQTEQVCEACLGLGGGGTSPCNVDLVCDPELGEDATNCPSDCP